MAHVLAQLKIVPKSDYSEAALLAKELGLELQAKRYEKSLPEDSFKPLTNDEITVWRNYCPTRYAPTGTERTKPLEQYAFDSVPVEVMRHWKKIKDNYAFDRYEIWTTERTANTDPLLIGVLGEKLFLLARWGLESPEETSLSAIAKEHHDRLLLEDEKDWSDMLSFHVDYFFRSAESKKLRVKERSLDWMCYHSGSDRLFRAYRRILGLPIPQKKFHY